MWKVQFAVSYGEYVHISNYFYVHCYFFLGVFAAVEQIILWMSWRLYIRHKDNKHDQHDPGNMTLYIVPLNQIE